MEIDKKQIVKDNSVILRDLVARCGGQTTATKIFREETGHHISQATVSRAMNNKGCKSGMSQFLVYALTNVLTKAGRYTPPNSANLQK